MTITEMRAAIAAAAPAIRAAAAASNDSRNQERRAFADDAGARIGRINAAR